MNVEKRNQLIERIKTLEGLTGEERTNLLDLLRTSYGLVWEDRPEDVEERLREQLPVLVEDKDKALTDGGPGAPNHVLIEGDNLEALTTLTYTHAGKIDVIYIDPPYNTGNKDFVYNDNFVDSEDGYRHSKWLSFMAKRLRIARKLLSDRGVIFISIDDNEYAQLKLLCDEVMGRSNFIACFIWKKKQGGGNDSKYVVTEHEYILTYAKQQQYFKIGLDLLYKPSDSLYPYHDEKGDYGLVTLDKASIQFSQSLVFEIKDPDGNIYYPRIVKGKQSCWRWGKQKVQDQYADLVFKNGKVYTKYYRPKGVTPRSLLIDVVYGRTESGRDDLSAIFDKAPFDYPKPVSLIKHFVSLGSLHSSIILDFFAGSGTTLHAVMQLNAEDGGHRQCILVTNNENGICENVTYERNKRVIKGYTKPNGDHVEGLAANNLRYYRTDFVPRTRSPHDLRHLVNLSTDMLCIKENLNHEAPITCNGRKIARKYARRFLNNEREMIIIYDSTVIPLIVEYIKAHEIKNEIKVYVHSYGRYAFDDDFGEVIDKITLCAIPDAILQAYRDVIPRAKDTELAPPVNVEDDEIQKAIEADGDYSYTDQKGGDQ